MLRAKITAAATFRRQKRDLQAEGACAQRCHHSLHVRNLEVDGEKYISTRELSRQLMQN